MRRWPAGVRRPRYPLTGHPWPVGVRRPRYPLTGHPWPARCSGARYAVLLRGHPTPAPDGAPRPACTVPPRHRKDKGEMAHKREMGNEALNENR